MFFGQDLHLSGEKIVVSKNQLAFCGDSYILWHPLILPFGCTMLAISRTVHLLERTSSPFAEHQEADCISNGSEDPGD